MKITINQLRRIIRETVEEVVDEADDIVTDAEFDAIVTESRRRINEDVGMGTIAIGTILGILGLKGLTVGLGVAATAAAALYSSFDKKNQDKLRAKARAAKQAAIDEAVLSLADDHQLADMFTKLAALKSTGTKREVEQLSKGITAYVKSNMKRTGASAMDVRKTMGRMGLPRR